MKKYFVLCVSILALVFSVTSAALSADGGVVAYDLLGSPKDVVLLSNSLASLLKEYKVYPFSQLNISFLSPTMNPLAIQKDIQTKNNNALFDDAFFSVDKHAPYLTATDNEGVLLHQLILNLTQHGVKVFFSVGGWAYSNGNMNNSSQSNITTTFPLTTDILAALKTYHPGATAVDFEANNHDGGFVGVHDTLDNVTTQALTDTWVSVAKAFGASGVDLDYEEQWLPAQAHQFIPDHLPNPHAWSFHNNYSTIKYAAYIQALERSAKASGLSVSIAAPAPGAFNVNAVTGGDAYAGNFFYPAGQTAPLKGVIFNMLHPNQAGLSSVSQLFTVGGASILNQLSTVGVMSYDLDDGYTAQHSYWCLAWRGTLAAGYLIARDPIDVGGHYDVSCSVFDQDLAVANSFNQLGLTSQVDMGVEAYYPNYPISPNTNVLSSASYRWNDAFVPFDLPLKSAPNLNPQQVFDVAQKACQKGGACEYLPQEVDYKHTWLVTSALASALKSEHDGVIFWSLNNAESAILQKDIQALSNQSNATFGAYSQSMNSFIKPLLTQYVASWQDILDTLYVSYDSDTK